MRHFTKIGIIVLFCIAYSFAETYYIRPNGNDSRDGTSDAKAWKSVDKIVTFAFNPGFAPGDSILFKAGVTHTVSRSLYLLADRSAGTPSNPITIGAYGGGRATIQATDTDFISVWGPDIGSATGAVSMGLRVEHLNIIDNDSIASNNGRGISIINNSTSSLGFLHIRQCDISGFSGGGILVAPFKAKGRIRDIKVQYVKAYNNPGESGNGIWISGADGVLVEHCITYGNGTDQLTNSGPFGIRLSDSRNATIQFCESYDNKTTQGDGAGFAIDSGCQNCVIQYCYSHDNDGAGFLLAQHSRNFFNYGPMENNVIRYNISQNDGRKNGFGGISFWGATATDHIGASEVHNNTVYTGGTPDNGSPACVWLKSDNVKDVNLRNNIFMADDGHTIIKADSLLTTSSTRFHGNCYWSAAGTPFQIKWGTNTYSSLSAWRSTGQEMQVSTPTGLEADPALKNPGQGGTIDNTTLLNSITAYQLKETSPLVNTGLNILQLFGVHPGNQDFWGNLLPTGSAYDIGAHEYQPVSSMQKVDLHNAPLHYDSYTSVREYDILGRSYNAAAQGRLVRIVIQQIPEFPYLKKVLH